MFLKDLGDTGLKVSPIGLGLAALGRPGYINIGHEEDLAGEYNESTMEHTAHEMLSLALKNGIRYFDTARSYGMGEVFLGNWLKKNDVTGCVVGSKWGYTYTAEWKVEAPYHEVKEHSIENLEKQYALSKGILGDRLNIYSIHSATIESRVLENRRVLLKLAEMKSNGILIGLSLSGPEQAELLKKAKKITYGGKRLFDVVQVTYNVLESAAKWQLEEAHDMGMGIVVKEALANGRLTNRNNHQDFKKSKRVLIGEARNLGTTIDALAIAAVLNHKFVDVVLSGAATKEHLLSNLKAIDIKVPERTMKALREISEGTVAYWDTRKSLDWN